MDWYYAGSKIDGDIVLPQMGLYTNKKVLSILYEIFSAKIFTFMQIYDKNAYLNLKLGLTVIGDVHVLIGKLGHTAAPGRPGQKA